MELRRAADVLLRPQTSPLSCLLNPASTSRWTAGRQLCYRTANNKQRAFTDSARNHAVRPQPTTSATPTETKDSDPPSKSFDELSKSLWASPSSRPSRPLMQLDSEREKRMNGGDSAADLIAAMRTAGRSTGFDSSRMLNPLAPNDNKSMMSDMAMGTLAIPQKPRVPMRLTPSTGRSIAIGTGIDVARGLRLLEQSCARNRVRADFTLQRFHERGGLKRKRLRRQRWRRRFIEGFRATVGRVKQLKHQGW
jgi:small subunit ribosomal protein MRP21